MFRLIWPRGRFQRNTRAIRLFVTLAIASLIFTLASVPASQNQLKRIPRSTHKNPTGSRLPEAQSRVSKIDCDPLAHTCLISNLYIIDGNLHAYTGDATWEELEGDKLEGLTIYPGIGFGSPFIRLEFAGRFAAPEDPIDETTFETEDEDSEEAKRDGKTTIVLNDDEKESGMPVGQERLVTKIKIHRQAPPEYLEPNVRYYVTPLAVFSVLWENLFRNIYAGVAAWFTMMEYKVFFPDHHRLVLIDPNRPRTFLPVLEAVTKYPVEWIEDLPDGVYRTVVLGLSKDAFVGEIDVERHHEFRFINRQRAFRSFCAEVKRKVLGENIMGTTDHIDHVRPEGKVENEPLRNPPRVSLILRDGNSRRILNEDAVIKSLQKFPMELSVYRFGQLSLHDQIKVVHNTDIFITMHGAALTHVLFLRPGAYVVELFPFGFRKTIFQNLARIMGVRYMFWQNTHGNDTVFRWDHVEANRFTEQPRELIENRPLDWYNMDSKNYWRNQDTNVNIGEFSQVIRTLMSSRSAGNENRYLMFLPWEQFNNQLIGFKSACALAKQLNRVLVLPHVGFRYRPNPRPTVDGKEVVEESANIDNSFQIYSFAWRPFDRYFDLTSLLSLPCQYIGFDNFVSLNQGRSIGTLRFHDIGPDSNTQQLVEYFGDVAKFSFDRIKTDKGVYYQMSASELQTLHATDSARVLALGSMFWYYDFGIKQSYPLTRYYDYYGRSELYRSIQNSLKPIETVFTVAQRFLASLKRKLWLAMHIRRGDYVKKCSALTDRTAYLSCWPSADAIVKAAEGAFPAQKLNTKIVYISTNSRIYEEVESLAKAGWRVLTIKDVDLSTNGTVNTLSDGMDPIHTGLVEQVICAGAEAFFGNLHSSFTRGIVERRQSVSRKSRFFGVDDEV